MKINILTDTYLTKPCYRQVFFKAHLICDNYCKKSFQYVINKEAMTRTYCMLQVSLEDKLIRPKFMKIIILTYTNLKNVCMLYSI